MQTSPSMPRLVLTTGTPTEQDREEWLRAREELIPPGAPPRLVNRFLDNKVMSSNVLDRARLIPTSFRGVRDAAGNLQAGAIVTNESNHLYIDLFSTAPWNIFRNSPMSFRRAGEALMAEIVKESRFRGHGGELRLISLTGSVTFYEDIGFVLDEESGEMSLSSERASRFLQRMQRRES